jgi:hypothetical protein
MQSWLVAVTQLPTEDPDARMRVLRTLESLGTAVMREGVYVLPDTPENRRALEALSEYIGKSAGSAQVLRVNAASAAQQSSLERLFDRTARYEELIKTVKSLRVGFGHSDPHAIARVLQKQRRDFEAIAALDFFPAQPRKRAEQALAKAQAEVQQLLATSSQPAVFGAAEKLQRRSWVTRKPAWADRLACAWLIRRFIDPEAKVMWLEKSGPPPSGALGFAYDGAHFTANARRVAYEEMLAKLDLGRNPALAKIASIVHFLEIGGTAVPEAAGVQTLLQGALRRSSSPQELVAEAEKTFDLLYEAYYEPPGAKR